MSKPDVIPPSAAQVAALADQFYKQMNENVGLAVEAFTSFTEIELAELLKRELTEFPASPLAVELRRRMRIIADGYADLTARQILED